MSIMADVMPRCMGFDVQTNSSVWGLLRDSREAISDVAELHRRMDADGYLYLPQLLGRGKVQEVRREVCARLAAAGYLREGTEPMDAIVSPDRKNPFMPEVAAKGNKKLEEVLYSGPLMNFCKTFLGGDVRHFDFTWFRTVGPGTGTPSHCDVVYMGRGTPRLYTAWTPIGDVDTQLGGLMILEGSHNHHKLRNGYCRMDVDAYCANTDGKDAWAKGTAGWLGKDPNQIRRSLTGRWLTCPEYRAGDVVLFSVFTVHAGLDNQTANRVRLSSDSRYQLAADPADERWIGENPVGHGPGGKKAMIC